LKSKTRFPRYKCETELAVGGAPANVRRETPPPPRQDQQKFRDLRYLCSHGSLVTFGTIMDDKNRILVPIVVFNLVFIFYQLLFNWYGSFTWTGLFIGLLAGIVAAAIAFGVLAAMKR